ncbi:thioredoxin family protein [Candidatus Fermentibacteria bacterium]|nr:thioredoxin family protein [Candidatus Fermentibacteria bacterium]
MRSFLTAAILALLSLSACGSPSPGGSGDAASGGASELTWIEEDFEAAAAASRESGKPILMDLYADWCGPCRTLSEEFFTSEEMRGVLSRFVLFRANVDGAGGGVLAERYGASAIPLVVVVSADGTEYDRIVGVPSSIAEYVSDLESILGAIK